MKIAINLNQMRKKYQIFGFVYSWWDNNTDSQLNISLKIYLGNSLDNSIVVFNGYFAICICIAVVYKYVSCTSDIHSLCVTQSVSMAQIFNGKNNSSHILNFQFYWMTITYLKSTVLWCMKRIMWYIRWIFTKYEPYVITRAF